MGDNSSLYEEMKKLSELHRSNFCKLSSFAQSEAMNNIQKKCASMYKETLKLDYLGAVSGLNEFSKYYSLLKTNYLSIIESIMPESLKVYKSVLEDKSNYFEIIAKMMTQLYQSCEGINAKYDFNKLNQILQQSITSNREKEINVEELVDEVVDKYDENFQFCGVAVKECTEINTKEEKKDIKSFVSFWIFGFIGFLICIYSVVNTKPTNVYNNTVEVNNYYVNDLEINADMLNSLSYRIINQNNVMPRINPDCSSRVIAHLNIGQIVIVSEKYKKWIRINWEDENGQEMSGWIQNYKLTEFK